MRIAFFSDNFYPELSGIADSILRTGTELGKRGHHVVFYAPQYTNKDFQKVGLPIEELSLPNIEVVRFASIPYPTGTGQGRVVIPTGYRTLTIKKFNPDIMHVHLPFGVGFEGMLASKLLRKPLIGTNHTTMSGFLNYSPLKGPLVEKIILKYTSWFYNRCQFVSSPSSPVIKEMQQYGFKRKNRVVSNPLETTIFTPRDGKSALKKKYGLEGFALLYAGRLAPEKNIEVVFDATSQLTKKIPDIKMGLVGSGSHEKELRARAKKLGIEDRVIFFGFIKDSEEMSRIYNASDIFVMPSTTETQSMTMIQGMLVELPIIAADAWGLPEYVSEKNGFLFKPDNVWELAQKIVHLKEHSALRKSLGKAGRELAVQFSPQNIADLWEQIYEEALSAYNRKI